MEETAKAAFKTRKSSPTSFDSADQQWSSQGSSQGSHSGGSQRDSPQQQSNIAPQDQVAPFPGFNAEAPFSGFSTEIYNTIPAQSNFDWNQLGFSNQPLASQQFPTYNAIPDGLFLSSNGDVPQPIPLENEWENLLAILGMPK